MLVIIFFSCFGFRDVLLPTYNACCFWRFKLRQKISYTRFQPHTSHLKKHSRLLPLSQYLKIFWNDTTEFAAGNDKALENKIIRIIQSKFLFSQQSELSRKLHRGSHNTWTVINKFLQNHASARADRMTVSTRSTPQHQNVSAICLFIYCQLFCYTEAPGKTQCRCHHQALW